MALHGHAYEVGSLNSPGDVSIPTQLIMLHGSMRSLMWWVPTINLILHMESGALLVEVMTCPIHVPQIFGLWDSGGPVRRTNENLQIPLTTSFTYLLPSWLLDNAEFQRVADDCFDLWFANRDSGLAGLSSFAGTMYACASTFLSTHVTIATTARQRLELALTAMRLLERHPIDERRLSRLCAADSVLFLGGVVCVTFLARTSDIFPFAWPEFA